MEKSKKKIKFPSELRFDLVSKHWVIIATGRGKRPEAYKEDKKREKGISRESCPFYKIENQEKPVLVYSDGQMVDFRSKKDLDAKQAWALVPADWSVAVFPNKYPALLPYPTLDKKIQGKLYQKMNAVGFCELVISKDHYRHFPQFSKSEIKEVLDIYHSRYKTLMKKNFVNYISIFHNHGREAGASQPHPHSQIITTPLIDIDLRTALSNSEVYFKEHNKCIYCQLNAWERKVKERIVFENKHFIAVCPFASKAAFEVIISPKEHSPYFEKVTDEEKLSLAEAFGMVFRALHKGLSNPAYNFYLHTSPCDKKEYPHYHWHWTILPKTSTPAGFEMGTRMEISTIEPEKAASYLRKQLRDIKKI